MSLCLGTSMRLIPPYGVGFTVFRILLCIALHCSDLMVFLTIFDFRLDSLCVSGLLSLSYVASRS